MNAASPSGTRPQRGFLGRGPYFWAALFIASAAGLGLLAVTGAVDDGDAILLLALVPIALLAALFRAIQVRLRAQRADGSRRGLAQAAYVRRVALFTVLYLAAVACMSVIETRMDPPVAVRLAVALMPGLAVIGFFWAIGRLMVEEEDEFLRMLTVRQSLVATALALSAASVWGFLESADLVPHLDAYWVAAAWFAGLFVGALVNRVQHGTWGSV
ncbi:MAG: hypothetical protein GVX90_01355 [Alphaproteobacteria bacterium]|jgi:FtsH-binding integral membrane protein|nr:hypothetical protein [Alphaproteobacteria bacterium]